tara:strand:- start:590 stop:781 length:192 start_codon:yes stop_codon:yes gene_type:complete
MIMTAFKFIKKFARDEDGATAIEYGLFAALIAAILVATVQLLGLQVLAGFESVSDALPALPTP